MSGGPDFHGSPGTDGGRDRLAAGLVIALLVAFVGVAIAKPWGSPVEPGPSADPPRAAVTPPASPEAMASVVPTAAPTKVEPLPVAFTTPLPPRSTAWAGLRWRRLAPDDPLSLVASVVRWSRGYFAVGAVAVPPATPVWTSADGEHWDELVFGDPKTFWRGLAVLGVSEGRTGLVALTETLEYCDEPCPLRFELPIVSWTSEDGRTWTRHLIPPEWLASPPGQPPLFADGPAGLVIASRGSAARLVTSTDGSQWHLLPAGAFPPRFALEDLRGIASGYVAVGRWMTIGTRLDAASLWSADGRHWSRLPLLLQTSSPDGSSIGSAPASLVVGRNGLVAVWRGVTTLGGTMWWQSPDGRHWAAMPTFAPLGPTTCVGGGCGAQPYGALVGDGNVMVAVRGGPAAEGWISSDGRQWRRVSMSGDIPSADATNATLLPGGVLLTDGTTTWFGAAVVPVRVERDPSTMPRRRGP
jgi:hypothetical protein